MKSVECKNNKRQGKNMRKLMMLTLMCLYQGQVVGNAGKIRLPSPEDIQVSEKEITASVGTIRFRWDFSKFHFPENKFPKNPQIQGPFKIHISGGLGVDIEYSMLMRPASKDEYIKDQSQKPGLSIKEKIIYGVLTMGASSDASYERSPFLLTPEFKNLQALRLVTPSKTVNFDSFQVGQLETIECAGDPNLTYFEEEE